ncbi:MAG: caspase family protein [Spirulinaceae cyanobacterium]
MTGRSYAIAIGIDNYRNIKKLDYAQRDAAAMRDYFRDELRFEQVFYFAEADDADAPPTYATLRRFFRQCSEDLTLEAGDNLWFFFAGHGVRHENRDYLLPIDADPGDVEGTAIELNYVTERLTCCGSDNVILLVDACRNTGRRDGQGVGALSYPGVVTFYSCSPFESSYEIEDLGQGAFTHTLLAGLRRQGEGNCATVERLDRHLAVAVPALNREYGKPSQTPKAEVAPASKYHLILLPRQANDADVNQLRVDAFEAETAKQWKQAEELWTRVWYLAPGDKRAKAAIKRIALKCVDIPSELLEVGLDTSGEKSVTPVEAQANFSEPYEQLPEDVNELESQEFISIPLIETEPGNTGEKDERVTTELQPNDAKVTQGVTTSQTSESQKSFNPNPPSLSQWLYQAIDLPEIRLRLRLRGNNLHILIESSHLPTAEVVRGRVEQALQEQTEGFQVFFRNTEDPVYKVILYGRSLGQQRPEWIESIVLVDLNLTPSTAEHLAREGFPDAIAHYLSESLSHLGVSVKVLVQKLSEPDPPNLKRLWVICSGHYSLDASLIAEPIAQQLRDLELKDFQDAIIHSQVQGETNPDWLRQVDLTHPTKLLWEWAKWGDAAAISRLLNHQLAPQHLDTRVIAQNQTLHIFCRPLPEHPDAPLIPPTQSTLHTVGQYLNELLPQGINGAVLYGIHTQTFPQTPASTKELPKLQNQTAWVNWLPFSHSADETMLTTHELARRQNVPALTFLLQRCLNPDIERFLTTGNIRVQLCFRGALLHIMTEAVVCPRQTSVIPKLETYLAHLDIPGVTGVYIYGRHTGQSSPLWSYTNRGETTTKPFFTKIFQIFKNK